MKNSRPSSPEIAKSIKSALFANRIDSVISIILISSAAWLGVKFVRWGIIDAVGLFGTREECRNASGACWAPIGNNIGLFLFGTYPLLDRWRCAVALIVIVAVFLTFFYRQIRSRVWGTILYVTSVLIAGFLLLGSASLGLPTVDIDVVGGLSLTIFVSWVALVTAIPLAVLLALGRQSTFPVIRAASTFYVEIVRGLPLVVVLFMAAVLFPLFSQGGESMAKVFRVIISICLFAAAYFSEVMRGGLQAISVEQSKAAASLGLGYWKTHFLVILPQTVPIVARPLSGMVITLFKNTSLISIIGLFEITGITTVVIAKPEWAPFSQETYVVVGAAYICCCFLISRLFSVIERQNSKHKDR